MHTQKLAGVRQTVEITLSLDTSIYAAGDVLFDSQPLVVQCPPGSTLMLESVDLVDQDDQGIAMDILFLNANQSLGTENSAPNISDANALTFLCKVPIETTDYLDLGGVRVATKQLNPPKPLQLAPGSVTFYVGGITRGGTPTHTASGARLRATLAF